MSVFTLASELLGVQIVQSSQACAPPPHFLQ